MDVYEAQIQEYLESFKIPEDYQQKILEAYTKLEQECDDSEQRAKMLRGRLERIKELYELGDLSRPEYLAKRDELHLELRRLEPVEQRSQNLERLAAFLSDVAQAWSSAGQGQRNKLAKQLFEEVWIKDKEVVAVKPRPELEPFFDLQYVDDQSSSIFGKWRKRRDSLWR